LAAGGVARSLQIHADMRLDGALPAAKISASSCYLNLFPPPYLPTEFIRRAVGISQLSDKILYPPFDGKKALGRGMRGRGMGKRDCRIIPLPIIPRPNIGLTSLPSGPSSLWWRLLFGRSSRGLIRKSEATNGPAKNRFAPAVRACFKNRLSGGRGRGGLLFWGGFFAFEVSDAALAFFGFVVLFAHKFFTLLR
jgi:hypothetical protein